MKKEIKKLSLTRKQKAVYDFIVTFKKANNDMSPSYREVAEGMGFKSTTQVWQFVDCLQKRGWVKKEAMARSITIL